MSYPLASSTWNHEEIEAMHSVIATGNYTMGRHVAAFEIEFARYVGAKHCVMVNSGSSANLLMIAALRYRKSKPLLSGSEIIVPAVSWSTTYYPLQQYGLRLKFVDIDSHTLNYDLSRLADAVTAQTAAIMAVNLLGNPNDFSKIREIIGARDILLLEDNCESMGAEFAGRQAGTHGLIGTYSAFFSHHISTMEGGMVVTDDEELYQILLSIRAHGWTRNLPKFNHVCGEKSDDPFVESFRFVLPGYNVRPLELSGAIGLAQLKKLPAMIEQRRRNAVQFLDLMQSFPQFRTQEEIGRSSWFGFSLIVESEQHFHRQKVVEVFRRHEIDVRPIVAGNFAKNEVMRWFDYEIHEKLTNADDIDANGFFIGNHHYDLTEQFATLRIALSEVVRAEM